MRPQDDEAPEDPGDDLVAILVRRVAPLVTLLAVMASAVRGVLQPLDTDDTFFHLRFGQEFLDGWSVREHGTVSDLATRDWVPTQWLAQVAMAWSEQIGGIAGVAWLAGLLHLTYVLVLYLACRRFAAPLVATVVTASCYLASGQGISARPQVISFILATVVVVAWMRTGQDGRPRWWLIPMTWVWAMLHGMWPVAVVTGLVGALGVLLDRRRLDRRVLQVSAVPALSLLAACLTPAGPALVREIFVVSGRGEYFAEWQPTAFTDWQPLLVAAILAIVIIIWVRSDTPAGWSNVGLLLLAGGWAVYSARTVPVSAATVAPIAAAALATLVPSRDHFARRDLWIAIGAWAASVAALAVIAPHVASVGMDEPREADDALSTLPAGTRVVNEWGWGGYLMWRHPDLDFMVSGYGDVFTTAELEQNVDVITLRAGWDIALERAGVEHAVLPPDSRLAYALRETKSWTIVHDGDDMQVLAAP